MMFPSVADFFLTEEAVIESGLADRSLRRKSEANELFRDRVEPGEGVRDPDMKSKASQTTFFYFS